MTPKMNAPTTAPVTVPRPPQNDAPPMITAEIDGELLRAGRRSGSPAFVPARR